MADYKIKTSISIDKEVYDKIKVFADNDDRSFSQFLNKLLKEYIISKNNK